MKTRAIRIHATGGPEALRLDEIDVPEPQAGQALVRHAAIGVNFIDVYHRSGLYPLPSLPHGIGSEGAGVVESVGPGVTSVRRGDRVAYAGGAPGAYAGMRVIAAERLVPLPEGIDERTAAAMMLKGMTVEYLIRRTFPVKAGTTVLWHAAAGGVGLIACQWLKALGAVVIGTAGDDAKAELARSNGCAHTIVYARENVAARVREITGGAGVAVVYDSVGRATVDASLDSVARRGMVVLFGNASGPVPPIDPLILSRKGSIFLTRPTLADYTATREDLAESSRALFDVVRSGSVKIRIQREWPLAEAAEAHRALEARRTTGSSVLVP